MYWKWHYGGAIRNLFQIWSNFVWFIFHFFSLGVLTRTLFAPWRRLDEGYAKGLAPEAWLQTLIVNGLMRTVGFIIRLIFIIVGSLVLLVMIILIVPVLIIWLLLPIVILTLFISGLILLF
jgi:hypothetical protein